MKRVFLAILSSSLFVDVAPRADTLVIRRDPVNYDCSLTIAEPGPFSLYVVHIFNSGSTASHWWIDDSSGIMRTGVTLNAAYLSLGDPYADVQVAYGGCVLGDHVLFRLDYLASVDDVTAPCSQVRIRPAPTSGIPGELAVLDCNLNFESANTAPFAINGPTDPFECECPPLGTEPSTWGKVKSLYR
ncbi:MAG: hypothetical protein L0Z51_11770 [Candidatus Latescibacteria bacterium]|nr:hypothetical protein [Candidatus Latescibacterota bacterium]